MWHLYLSLVYVSCLSLFDEGPELTLCRYFCKRVLTRSPLRSLFPHTQLILPVTPPLTFAETFLKTFTYPRKKPQVLPNPVFTTNYLPQVPMIWNTLRTSFSTGRGVDLQDDFTTCIHGITSIFWVNIYRLGSWTVLKCIFVCHKIVAKWYTT